VRDWSALYRVVSPPTLSPLWFGPDHRCNCPGCCRRAQRLRSERSLVSAEARIPDDLPAGVFAMISRRHNRPERSTPYGARLVPRGRLADGRQLRHCGASSGSLSTQRGERELPERRARQFLPQLPTVSEAALPGYQAGTWYGVLARPVCLAISSRNSTRKSSGSLPPPRFKERLATQGAEPRRQTPRSSLQR